VMSKALVKSFRFRTYSKAEDKSSIGQADVQQSNPVNPHLCALVQNESAYWLTLAKRSSVRCSGNAYATPAHYALVSTVWIARIFTYSSVYVHENSRVGYSCNRSTIAFSSRLTDFSDFVDSVHSASGSRANRSNYNGGELLTCRKLVWIQQSYVPTKNGISPASTSFSSASLRASPRRE
jgi:hypothetical protein